MSRKQVTIQNKLKKYINEYPDYPIVTIKDISDSSYSRIACDIKDVFIGEILDSNIDFIEDSSYKYYDRELFREDAISYCDMNAIHVDIDQFISRYDKFWHKCITICV